MSTGSEGQTRRALLVAGAGGLAAAAAATIGRPLVAQAGMPTPVYRGQTGQTAISTTGLTTSGGSGFEATTSDATGIGVFGYNSATTGDTLGVMGRQHSSSGSAVYGVADAGATGVYGTSGPLEYTSVPNTGVYGRSTDALTSSRGVWGESAAGVGVYGTSHGTQPAILGHTTTTAPAIQGHSLQGRGGVFKGNSAQIQLVPTGIRTHPESGKAGDLYVDKSKRLWFCKGGTTWKQIA